MVGSSFNTPTDTPTDTTASPAPAGAPGAGVDEVRDAAVSRDFPLEKIRDIGIIAHIDAGKTTVTERVLYYTGRTYKIGGVDEGTTIMDWMDQERERGITITSAATTCSWQGYRINIIDTPGHVDFTAEVERSLRVLDGGIVVFDAVAGVEPQSETVWRQADRYLVPRLCFINKMDRRGADLERTVGMIKQRLTGHPLIIQIPLGVEEAFRGVIDLVENRALIFPDDPAEPPLVEPIPAGSQEAAQEAREALLEALAEVDDQLLISYLEGRDIPVRELKAALRRATLAAQAVPVLCGSALKNRGIQPLLDAVIDYLPSPMDVPPVKGTDPKTGAEVERSPSDEEPFSALAFKVVSDPYMGRLVYFRVYSGRVKVGDQVLNSTKDNKERIGRLVVMHANHREEIREVDTGSIAATLGLKNTFTGDTLCDRTNPVLLEPISFPEPVISVAIEPKTKADQDRLGEALNRLAEEDPTFKVSHNDETGQTLISGMGELHLEVLGERMRREFKVGAQMGKPQVAYRETITQAVKSEGRFVRQVGGHGQYGHVWVEFRPAERGAGFTFIDAVKGGTIPKQYINPVKAGIKEAMESGGTTGYPLVDVEATLVDGSYHEVDSSDLAFKMAGSLALRNGLGRAEPSLLEPVMKLEVVTPEEVVGEIIGDLSARRGQIEGMEAFGNTRVVRCLVPLAETFGYATDLRSLSRGRATYSMEFHRYEPVPKGLVQGVVAGA